MGQSALEFRARFTRHRRRHLRSRKCGHRCCCASWPGANICWLTAPPGSSIGLRGASFARSEEHTSELQSLMRISYAFFCLKKKTNFLFLFFTFFLLFYF